ncbi:hypothetical protein [Saccharopolyspora spinosa]|uniref:hypothetical protein n=1 Tax=Saccharopolyspora spinosa TaxID=60894 RepID=UPI00147614FF|nr:hypothetical protein [Saccharopolyspora spinosa]
MTGMPEWRLITMLPMIAAVSVDGHCLCGQIGVVHALVRHGGEGARSGDAAAGLPADWVPTVAPRAPALRVIDARHHVSMTEVDCMDVRTPVHVGW